MIVKMKKLTLMVIESKRQALLEGLRDLGIVHIKNISRPVSRDLEQAQNAINHAEEAVEILNSVKALKRRSRLKDSFFGGPEAHIC